jgi:hypothetical protein
MEQQWMQKEVIQLLCVSHEIEIDFVKEQLFLTRLKFLFLLSDVACQNGHTEVMKTLLKAGGR